MNNCKIAKAQFISKCIQGTSFLWQTPIQTIEEDSFINISLIYTLWYELSSNLDARRDFWQNIYYKKAGPFEPFLS